MNKNKIFMRKIMKTAIKRKRKNVEVYPRFFLRDSKSGNAVLMGARLAEEKKDVVPEVLRNLVNERNIDEVTWVADAFVGELNNDSEKDEALVVYRETKDGSTSLIRKYKTREDGSIEFGDELWDENNAMDGRLTGFVKKV